MNDTNNGNDFSQTPPRDATLWLAFSVGWTVVTIVAWLVAASTSSSSISSSWGTTVAIIAVAVGVQLRWPIFSTLPHFADDPASQDSSESVDHIVWLLGCGASLNIIGYIVHRSSSITAALPAMALILLSELWMHRRLHSQRLAWIPLPAMMTKLSGFFASIWTESSSEGEAERELSNQIRLAESFEGGESDQASELDSNLLRRTVDGLSEEGQRFLSGEIRVALAANQQLETVVVSFCPAFPGPPDVELELEADDVSAQITACTAAGMRVSLRRRSGLDRSTILLQWYALESDVAESERLASRTLP